MFLGIWINILLCVKSKCIIINIFQNYHSYYKEIKITATFLINSDIPENCYVSGIIFQRIIFLSSSHHSTYEHILCISYMHSGVYADHIQ